MQELKEKYNISDSFFKRYFDENAQNRFAVESLNFLWHKKGKFLNPAKKDVILSDFIKEEIENFFEKKELNIPQIEFCITTRCSLKCKDCNALIPKFCEYKKQIDTNFDDFKLYLDKLCDSVNKIRHFILIGGEPLLNKQIDLMLEYACQKNNIDKIRILTNGTIVPSDELLKVSEKYKEKVYYYISNYAVNEELKPRLKHDEIKNALKNINVRFQLIDNWMWFEEHGFRLCAQDSKETLEKLAKCPRVRCTQLLNGKIDICSKARTAQELGMLEIKDFVDIKNSPDLKKDLIKFYSSPYQEACSYCILNSGDAVPAMQIRK